MRNKRHTEKKALNRFSFSHHNPIRYCDATGLPILCVKCYRIPKDQKKRNGYYVCDFHKAVDEYRVMDKIDDSNPFRLPTFIEKIDWDKVQTSCQPELALLYREFKKTNADIARRVV